MTKGDRFIHARVLTEDYRPAVCTISKIAQGVVYYRVGGEKKARNYFPIEQAARWVKEWIK
jgi:hypothetical protein